MSEIPLFGTTVDSTLLFQIVMPTLVAIGVIFAYLNYRKKAVNCTIIIQGIDPNKLADEAVLKKISDCIAKKAPELTGTIEKDAKIVLS